MDEGRRLTELRRSNASGKHDPRPRKLRNRKARREDAIRRSKEEE